jgi:hypothetical protein
LAHEIDPYDAIGKHSHYGHFGFEDDLFHSLRFLLVGFIILGDFEVGLFLVVGSVGTERVVQIDRKFEF